MIDGSFRDHFHAIDSLARQDFPNAEFEAIWVEYYDSVRPELAAKIESHPSMRLLTLGRSGEYHSSYCFNAGISAASGALVLIPDADLVMESDFLSRQWALHAKNDELVTYCYRYNEPREASPGDGTAELEHLKRVGVLTHPNNWGACVGVRRKWLLELNGYDQHPVFASGDHGNDFDLYVRLKNLGLQIQWPREPVVYHAWHPGTLVYAYSHKLQALVTKRRSFERSTLPYNGIDAGHDRSMPHDLLDELATARERFEAERPAGAGAPLETPPWLIRETAN